MTARLRPLLSSTLKLSVLLSLLFSLGPAGWLPVHAQDANPGASATAPLIPHPFNSHKPVCPGPAGPGFAALPLRGRDRCSRSADGLV